MYGSESVQTWDSQANQGTADVLTATGDHNGTMDIVHPIRVIRIGAYITTATVSSGGIVVAFDKRITKGSDTGRVDAGIGSITIPTATAVGKQVYKNVRVDVAIGDEIVPEVTTAAAGGGAAGGCHYFVLYQARNELPGNQSDAVASA